MDIHCSSSSVLHFVCLFVFPTILCLHPHLNSILFSQLFATKWSKTWDSNSLCIFIFMSFWKYLSIYICYSWAYVKCVPRLELPTLLLFVCISRIIFNSFFNISNMHLKSDHLIYLLLLLDCILFRFRALCVFWKFSFHEYYELVILCWVVWWWFVRLIALEVP